MPYSTPDDLKDEMTDYGLVTYFGWSASDVWTAKDKARVEKWIRFADKLIDGKLLACGLKVKTAGDVIKSCSVWLAAGHAPKKGQEAAWIAQQAQAHLGVLQQICDRALRLDDEVQPITTTGTAPTVSTPTVTHGEGITWS